MEKGKSNKKKGIIVFRENVKEMYFEKEFEQLKEMIKGFSFNDFISGSKIYELRELTEKSCETYIYYNYEWMTLGSFMRSVKPGEKYYLGGILDYHC